MRLETFRIVMHIAAAFGWTLHQLDVKTAFLWGKLPPGEHVYMEQPVGFEVPGMEDFIWMLIMGLYGLPNAGRVWYEAMNAAMIDLGYVRVACEHCLYYRKAPTGTVLAGIHVHQQNINLLENAWRGQKTISRQKFLKISSALGVNLRVYLSVIL